MLCQVLQLICFLLVLSALHLMSNQTSPQSANKQMAHQPLCDLSPFASGCRCPASGWSFPAGKPTSSGTEMFAAADAPVSSSRVRVAAATALGAAAVKAKVLAEAEEREVQRQVQAAIEAQMQKVQLKLNSMAELEKALEQERSIMEVPMCIMGLTRTP